jgi:hypothetical protein
METVAKKKKKKKKKKAPRTRRGPRRRRPEDEAREGSGIHKSWPSQASGQESSWNTRDRRERGGRQCRQAGLPLVTPCVGTATDWWYRTVPKWTQAKWT